MSLHIPIIKVKTATGYATLEVDMDATNEDGTPVFTDQVYQHIIAAGLKAILNSGMSGSKVGAVTKMTGAELEKAHAAAMRIANENLVALKAGRVKRTTAKKSTIPTEVRAEAMRLARTAIKDLVRNAGIKPSAYPEKVYTTKAKEYIESDPTYIEQARANIEARKTPQFKINLDISTLGPKLIRKHKAEPTMPLGALALKPVHHVGPRH